MTIDKRFPDDLAETEELKLRVIEEPGSAASQAAPHGPAIPSPEYDTTSVSFPLEHERTIPSVSVDLRADDDGEGRMHDALKERIVRPDANRTSQLRLQDASQYEVGEMIGRGGMGAVYKAHHKDIDRPMALKVVRPELVRDPVVMKRFQREVEAASNLTHPNLANVYEQGRTVDGAPYFVMDYIDGLSLSQLLREEGPMPAPRAMDIFLQIADALEHAHRKGVIHRDVKPSNIIITHPPGQPGVDIVKVVDFGIAKILAPGGQEENKITRTAQVLGSPLYMSPEQGLGHKIDWRSDIYSLGCVMYETLTGDPPLLGDTAIHTILKKAHEDATPLTLPRIANSEMMLNFQAIIMKALEKRLRDRYQSMHDLRMDLLRVREGKPPKKASWLGTRGQRNLQILGGFAALAILFGTLAGTHIGGLMNQMRDASAQWMRQGPDPTIRNRQGQVLFKSPGGRANNYAELLEEALQKLSNLSGANFANWSFERVENKQAQQLRVSGANFSDADFSGATLLDFDTSNCDFGDANFSGTTFQACIFSHCNFRGADFSRAKLAGCRFMMCDLTGARFADNVELKIGNTPSPSSFFHCTMDGATFINSDWLKPRQ